jgi:hypothetical protein
MPSYQTAKLHEYPRPFLDVAEDLFNKVSAHLRPERVERHEGSFSIYADDVEETVAKIVIYDPYLGRASHDWPHVRDGVYVWVRANGSAGEGMWGGILPTEMPWMFERMWRDVTVQIAANPQAEFTYFPVMAGDDLDDIADFIAACSRAAAPALHQHSFSVSS